jgi:glycosyltransferase involved in cell wall biosynthesis
LRAFASAVQQIPCRLEIVGDGPERGALIALAAQLGISEQVHFTGQLADPSPAYSRFDVFALSSDTEQMPYTVIEAMAAQCPIVATDVGDIAMMVAPQNRPFIVPKDDQTVSAALLRLVSNPSLREEIGIANLHTARQNFNQGDMFRAFAEIYEAPELIAT